MLSARALDYIPRSDSGFDNLMLDLSLPERPSRCAVSAAIG
jgi:hypothetical protein